MVSACFVVAVAECFRGVGVGFESEFQTHIQLGGECSAKNEWLRLMIILKYLSYLYLFVWLPQGLVAARGLSSCDMCLVALQHVVS